MKIPSLLLPLMSSFALLSSSLMAADPIQTQSYASGNMEVDVTKAAVRDGILTIQITIRNKGADEASIEKYEVSGNYYIDPKEKKKYHVLTDSAGTYLAYPVYDARFISGGSGGYPIKIPAGGKTIMWFKFPAPPAGTAKIDLFIHDVLPFEELPISQ